MGVSGIVGVLNEFLDNRQTVLVSISQVIGDQVYDIGCVSFHFSNSEEESMNSTSDIILWTLRLSNVWAEWHDFTLAEAPNSLPSIEEVEGSNEKILRFQTLVEG